MAVYRSWQDADGVAYRLSTPAPGVWRLQSARPDGTFDDRGAAQELAEFDRLDDTGTDAPLAAAAPRPFDDAPSAHPGITNWKSGGDLVSHNAETGVVTFQGGQFPLGGLNLRPTATARGAGAEAMLAGGERLLGFGERFDACDQRGRAPTMWSEDRWAQTEGNTYCPVPFVFSTRGYALFLNRFEKLWVDPGREAPDRLRFEQGDAPLDLYVFSGATPADLLRDFVRLTGRPLVPPDWALGVYVCRHARLKEFNTPEGVDAMMAAMAEHRLPYTAVILEGWAAYNEVSYPAMREAVARLRAAGKQPLVYEMMARLVCVGVGDGEAPPTRVGDPAAASPRNAAIAEGIRRGYYVRAQNGDDFLADVHTFNPADAPMRRASLWLDVTRPEAVAWWREKVWGPLVDGMGVAGAKIDFCEEFPEYPGMRFAAGASCAGEHVRYPVRYNAQMYRFFRGARASGGACFSRGGGVGAQRYPLMWAGDQLREWRFLRPQLTACLSAGLSGIPFMAYDLGGYLPARDPAADPEAPIFARGAQMACFSAAMQTHGTVTRPYDFPEPVVAVYRAYSELHMALLPYLSEQAAAAADTGLPLARHLALDFPGDLFAEGCEDAYLFGPSVLVAPMLAPGGARDVYLPRGEWEDAWTGRRHAGERWLRDHPAPLARVPFFVRRGRETPAWRAVEPAVEAWLGRYRALSLEA